MMKKVEFCRSIESIKQDDELKAEIMKAVEENDKVIVIKRPLFVPLLTAALVCFNLGIVAKLIIFNKSQVNMSEFKARTSMSSVSNDSMLSDELEAQKKLDKIKEDQKQIEEEQKLLDKEAEQIKNQAAFDQYLADFQTKINDEDYVVVDEWTSPKENYDPMSEQPFYLDTLWMLERHDDTTPLGYYQYRRYVQQIFFVEDTFMRDGVENKRIDRIYTNHEYIVGYDGNGFEPENIVSITESNVMPTELTEEFLSEECKKMNDNQKVTDKYIEFGENIMIGYKDKFEHTTYNMDEKFYLYSKSGNAGIDSGKLVWRCYAAAGSKELFDPLKDCESIAYYYINAYGAEINSAIEATRNNYWKDTVYTELSGSKKKVKMPDIIGMDVQEAEKVLNEAGLTIGSRYYTEYNDDPNIGFNQVTSASPYTANISTLYEGDKVNVEICAQTVPQIIYYTLDEAVKLLEARGLNVEIQYLDGVEKNVNEQLYVYTCAPYAGSPITPGSTVKIIATTLDGDTTSALVGKVISLQGNKVCSSDEAEKILSGTPTSELTEISLSHLGDNEYTDTTALGKYYGDDYFKVEVIKTQSYYGNCIPQIQCGMEYKSFSDEYNEEHLNSHVFYSAHNAQLTTSNYEDYNYLLTYEYSDGRKRFAYIKTEPCEDHPETVGFVEAERINKICVSEYALS